MSKNSGLFPPRFTASILVATLWPALAHATEECRINTGLPADPAAYVESAQACLTGAPGVTFNANAEAELARLTNVARKGAGKPVMSALDSLNAAARIHALDLAARGYASHTDLEGRSHLDRVRLLERQFLIGAFGAVVTIVPAGSSEKDIQLALLADPLNAENLLRREFERAGIGVAESQGQIFVVQLFASTPGRLSAPLPVAVSKGASLAVSDDPSRKFNRWQIADQSGAPLMSGRTPNLPDDRVIKTGFLTLEFQENGRTVSLKGPAVKSK